jgi:hypothetical protein
VHWARLLRLRSPNTKQFVELLSNDEQSASGSRRPHTFPWLVYAHSQDSLAFWAWACICDCNTYSDIFVNRLLCFLLYFDGSSVGNVGMHSSYYFSPSFWTLCIISIHVLSEKKVVLFKRPSHSFGHLDGLLLGGVGKQSTRELSSGQT